MNTIRWNGSSVLILLAVTLAAATGCRSSWSDGKLGNMFSMKRGMPWHDEAEDEVGIPERIVATWTDTVLHKSGEVPQRGFGGRLVFYGRESKDPILVDGQLVVYAFEESDRDPTDNKPTRKYVFPADQVTPRMSKSELGAAYSFWLPWDETGGPQTEVSLICRFEPKKGGVIVSEQTRHRLPGTLPGGGGVARGGPPKLPEGIPSRPAMPGMTGQVKESARQAQQASFESTQMQAAAEETAAARRMSTTTIALPQNFRMPGNATPIDADPAAGATSAGAQAEMRTVAPSTPAPALHHQGQALQQQPASPSNPPAAIAHPQAGSAAGTLSHGAPLSGQMALGRRGYTPLSGPQPFAISAMPFAANAQLVGTPITPLQAAAQIGVPQAAGAMPEVQPGASQIGGLAASGAAPGAGPLAMNHGAQTMAIDAGTTVSYLSPAESLRWEMGQRSYGSQRPIHPAPSPPAFR